jgi:hypothetical protein
MKEGIKGYERDGIKGYQLERCRLHGNVSRPNYCKSPKQPGEACPVLPIRAAC